MKTPQQLQAAIDTLLDEGGHVPEGWLVVFLHPDTADAEEGAARFGRLLKALSTRQRLLVGGERDPFRPRPHILHRIVVRNAREERFDYFFFPEAEVVISGYWDQTFPVIFPREADIGWLVEAVEAAGMVLLPPDGEE